MRRGGRGEKKERGMKEKVEGGEGNRGRKGGIEKADTGLDN